MLPALWKTKKSWYWEQNDLSPVGNPCTQGGQPRMWLCPLCAVSKKQPWSWSWFVQWKKRGIFPVSCCFFLFALTQLGWPRSSLCNSIHGSSSCIQSCWSIPLHCRHCGQGKGQYFLAMDCFKGHCRIICFGWKYVFIVPSYQILYHCTVLNLQVFWSMNITSSCKGAVFKMLRQLTESQLSMFSNV